MYTVLDWFIAHLTWLEKRHAAQVDPNVSCTDCAECGITISECSVNPFFSVFNQRNHCLIQMKCCSSKVHANDHFAGHLCGHFGEIAGDDLSPKSIVRIPEFWSLWAWAAVLCCICLTKLKQLHLLLTLRKWTLQSSDSLGCLKSKIKLDPVWLCSLFRHDIGLKFEAKIFTEGRWRSMKMTAILPETLQGVAVSCRFFQWADKLIFDSQHLREAERGRETSLSNPRPWWDVSARYWTD